MTREDMASLARQIWPDTTGIHLAMAILHADDLKLAKVRAAFHVMAATQNAAKDAALEEATK